MFNVVIKSKENCVPWHHFNTLNNVQLGYETWLSMHFWKCTFVFQMWSMDQEHQCQQIT